MLERQKGEVKRLQKLLKEAKSKRAVAKREGADAKRFASKVIADAKAKAKKAKARLNTMRRGIARVRK